MCTFKSPDGRTSFKFEKTDYTDANGSKSHCFHFNVNSFGFTADLDGIWFYEDDLLAFSKELRSLANSENNKAKIMAMSDFEIVIEKEDSVGHFLVQIKLENPVCGNSANLTSKLETQSLLDFSNEL